MTGFGAGVFMYVGLLALTMARHFLGAPVRAKDPVTFSGCTWRR